MAGAQTLLAQYLSSSAQKKALKNFQPAEVGLDSLDSNQREYLSQMGHMPAISDMLAGVSARDNQAFRDRLSSVSPTLVDDVGRLTSNAGAFARGEVPDSVQNQIKSSAGYQNLQGGLGAGLHPHGLTARDLGTTSTALMGRGGQMLGQGLKMTEALNPENLMAGKQLLSTHDVLARNDAKNYYNNRLENARRVGVATGKAISPWGAALAAGIGAYTANMAATQGGGQQQQQQGGGGNQVNWGGVQNMYGSNSSLGGDWSG